MAENTPSGIEWRYTAKKVRIGAFDANAIVPPLLLFAMHIKWWTFVLALIVVFSMWILELFFRLPMKEAMRTGRRILAGKHRPVTPWWEERRL